MTRRLREEAQALGFDAVGIAPILRSDHGAFLRAWLERGFHGSMHYLERDDAVRARLDPRSAWPGLRSAVVVALNYYPGGNAGAERDPGRGIVARYARGRDYHKVIKKKLLKLLAWLEAELGHELPAARAYVDTGPVLERELAQRAGLGWFGRNTMLIDPRRGSYFFLGTLLLEVELEYDDPFATDHCGTCSRCLPACPTGALLGRDETGAPVMDATRCISYLTIENGGPIPRELRPLIGNRVFGCDICQEVCPWNGPKFVRITRERDFSSREPADVYVYDTDPGSDGGGQEGVGAGNAWNGRDGDGDRKRRRDQGGHGRDRERLRSRRRGREARLPGTGKADLIALMRMSYAEWDVWTRGSAMRRAGYGGWRRNVAVALGNWGDESAVPVLIDALHDAEPLVRGHAAWALVETSSPSVPAALAERLVLEDDPWVREELELSLARFSERSSARGRSGEERSVT